MAYEVTASAGLRVREGTWDAARGREQVFAWATEGDDTDLAKAARGHTVADLDPDGRDPTRADLKLPICYVEGGELIAIGNGIRAALARLSQVDGLSEAVEGEARALFEGLLDKLKRQDVERSEDERAQIREEFPVYITMTPSQMRTWGDSPFAGQNRKSGEEAASAREALSDVLRLKEKQMADWTERDYDDAVEAIAFVQRMQEVEQGEPLVIEGREGPSARDASLRDWGHWTAADAREQAVDGEARSWIADMRPPSPRSDGAVFRCDRMPIEVVPEAQAALDRAIEIAGRRELTDEAITDIADELRRDGLDDYLTPEAFFLCRVRAARTGVQIYSNGVTEWGEYRSVDEVRRSLVSWALRPMTNDHPPVLVTPDNYRDYAVGSTGQDAILVEAPDGEMYVELTIMVGDVAALRAIRDGKVELSAGYTVLPVNDPGRAPNGDRYKYRQTDIQINHLALVDRGRAGPLARIELDGAAWQIERTTDTEDHMPKNNLQTALDMMREVDAPEDYIRGAIMLLEAAMSGEPMTPEAMESLKAMLEGDMGHEPEAEMDSVELAPGLTVKMTVDQAKAWKAHAAKVSTDAHARTSLDAKVAEMATKMVEMQATIDSQSASIQRSERRVASADRARLIAETRSVSPTLVASWDARARSKDEAVRKAFDAMTSTDLKVEFLRDLGEDALNEGLDAVSGTDAFPTYVDAMYRRELGQAKARKKAHGDAGRTGSAPAGRGRTSLNDSIREKHYH